MVLLVYSISAALALLLLLIFRAKSWYWHVLSVLLAMAVGLVPRNPDWNTANADLAFGAVFTFLLLWGIAAPLFRRRS
jgi:hypothetical protein